MKTTALIERGKDGTYGVYTSEINSVIIGSGQTVEDAKADFENSVMEIVAFYKQDGIPLPDELIDVEFEYKYDAPSFLNRSPKVPATAGLGRLVGSKHHQLTPA